MIKLTVCIDSAIKDLDEILQDSSQFIGRQFDKPEFKYWKENICSFIRRTYDRGEANEKLTQFNNLCFITPTAEEIFPSLSFLKPFDGGLGDAICIIKSWKNDLEKRRKEHSMDWLKKILSYIVAALVAGATIYLIGVSVSTRNINNSGVMNNVNLGDNSSQQSLK